MLYETEYDSFQSRNEKILENILGAENELVAPQSRVEAILQAILYNTPYDAETQSRIEKILLAIKNSGEYDAEAESRNEEILLCILHHVKYDKEPQSPIEELLIEWAEQSAGELKTVSGTVISIADALAKAVDDLTVSIEPVQDLHGYDKPWVGGAGKNICPPVDADWFGGYLDTNGVLQGDTTNGEKTSPFIEVSASQSYVFSYSLNGTPSDQYWACICFYNSSKALTGNRITNGHTLTKYDVVGTSPADAAYIRISFRSYGFDNTVQIEKGSTATAWTPYSNICPITGHESVNVVRTGKNLCDLVPYQSGTSQVRFGSGSAYVYPYFLKAGTYTFSSKGEQTYTYWQRKGTSDINIIHDSSTLVGTFTLPKDDYYRFWMYAGGIDAENVLEPMIELGTTATEYEPYVGDEYEIDLDGTRYGGSLDVTTGVLTVTHHFVTYDGSENWGTGANYFVVWNQPNSKGNNDLTQIANWLTGGGSSGYSNYGYYRAQANGAVCVGNIGSPWADVTAFKDALSSTPLQICYELATPITIQLTPTEIQMLAGNNTLWADAGDSTLTYWAEV